MNEPLKLNRQLVKTWLKDGCRTHRYLEQELRVSYSLVARMLSKEALVPNKETLQELAELMGVGVQDLLIPRDEQAA